MDAEYAWRKKKKAQSPQNTVPTVKPGGRNIMLWECFSCQGTMNLVRVQGNMGKEDYTQIFDKKKTEEICRKAPIR